jgi:GT2 family glycosyltransferase
MNEIGEWDEQFNHGGEDFDITLRIDKLGYKMIVARKAFIYHYGGASTREYIGDDLEVVRRHHKDMIDLLIKKHGLEVQDTYDRLMKK